jgi:hypothetical protein
MLKEVWQFNEWLLWFTGTSQLFLQLMTYVPKESQTDSTVNTLANCEYLAPWVRGWEGGVAHWNAENRKGSIYKKLINIRKSNYNLLKSTKSILK